jgi:hypothetical protein
MIFPLLTAQTLSLTIFRLLERKSNYISRTNEF